MAMYEEQVMVDSEKQETDDSRIDCLPRWVGRLRYQYGDSKVSWWHIGVVLWPWKNLTLLQVSLGELVILVMTAAASLGILVGTAIKIELGIAWLALLLYMCGSSFLSVSVICCRKGMIEYKAYLVKNYFYSLLVPSFFWHLVAYILFKKHSG